MTLTPQQLQAIRAREGIKPTPATGTPDRAANLKAAWGTAPVVAPKKESDGFLKSLVKAPLTMIARPIQAVAELAGVSDEAVNKFSEEKLGGFVAPTPQNAGDVKKDIGRAVQTVALGAGGPVSGGAAFGLGSSLEQGNDLLSVQTALDTALGAAGGKVLDLVGKPVFNVAGKVVGKITPDFIKELSGKGSKAIQDFAAHHEIFPENISKGITKVADKAEVIANAPFKKAGQPIIAIKNKIMPDEKKIIEGRIKALGEIENSRAPIRNYVAKQEAKGFNPKEFISKNSDLIQGAVDKEGTIRTKQPGGAIEQYQEFIKPQESIVRDTLEQEGKIVHLDDVEKHLTDAINKSNMKGSAKVEALNGVKKEIAGLRLDADEAGNIPLATIHDAKVSKYAHVNYLNPETGASDKLIAKGLKQIVEDNSSGPVKKLNEELAHHYANIGYLERLDGSKVKGGRLGKYLAKGIGAMIGSGLGPVGTLGGAELGGMVQGKIMSSTLSRGIGKDLESSALMKEAQSSLRNKSLNQNQATSDIKVNKNPISKSIPESKFTASQGGEISKVLIDSIDKKVTNPTSFEISIKPFQGKDVKWITIRGDDGFVSYAEPMLKKEIGIDNVENLKSKLIDLYKPSSFKLPTVGKTVHPKLKGLYDTAPEAKAHIDAVADQIASKYDGKVAKTDLKNPETAYEKLINRKGGRVEDMNDITRNTIVVDNHNLADAREDLFNQKGAMNQREVTSDIDPLGYSGNTANIKTPNGHIAEIQLNTPEMIFAKEKEEVAKSILGEDVFNQLKSKYDALGIKGGEGHTYYEKYRIETSPEIKDKLAKMSREYYDAIRNA